MRMIQVAATVVGAYLILVALAWMFQRRLIYMPMGGVPPAAREVLPGAEDVVLETEDGLRLGAWYVPAVGGDPLVTVVFCNGNAGNRAMRAPLAAALARNGIAVLLFDYRGYAGNPGSPSEAGLAADLRAARDHLAAERGVPSERQVLFGESLGAAVTLAGAVDAPPAGLVLRSPFTSLVDAGRSHYPFLPVGALLWDRYPSLERIGLLRCPLLVLAGERDRIVPAAQSRELYAAAETEDKRFVGFPDDDHNSAQFLDGPEMVDVVVEFARRVAVGRE